MEKNEGEVPKRTLDLGLDIVNGIRRLDLKRDGLARQGLDENLHRGRSLNLPPRRSRHGRAKEV
jgi:hypothetical protein